MVLAKSVKLAKKIAVKMINELFFFAFNFHFHASTY